MSKCTNCSHKKVCGKYTATGGHVKECGYSMDNYAATEAAYKNGYEKGVREFAKKLIEHYFYDLERRFLFEEDIDCFVEEVIKK